MTKKILSFLKKFPYLNPTTLARHLNIPDNVLRLAKVNGEIPEKHIEKIVTELEKLGFKK